MNSYYIGGIFSFDKCETVITTSMKCESKLSKGVDFIIAITGKIKEPVPSEKNCQLKCTDNKIVFFDKRGVSKTFGAEFRDVSTKIGLKHEFNNFLQMPLTNYITCTIDSTETLDVESSGSDKIAPKIKLEKMLRKINENRGELKVENLITTENNLLDFISNRDVSMELAYHLHKHFEEITGIDFMTIEGTFSSRFPGLKTSILPIKESDKSFFTCIEESAKYFIR